MGKNEIGLSVEFFVLAQLARQGYVATLTLGNTKGVDILVSNEQYKTVYRVEAKTTVAKPRHARLFGDMLFYTWPMDKKHETIIDPNLFYCFVQLGALNELPKFFIVPSREVAGGIKKQHWQWLASKGRTKDVTTMRCFRIPIDDPNHYQDNWGVFQPVLGETESSSST